MSQQERDLIISRDIARQPGGPLRDFLTPATEAAAAAWRWEVLEASIRVEGSVSVVGEMVERSIARIGKPQPDSDALVALVGTGWRNANCAVLTVKPGSGYGDAEVALLVRSVAPEGIIKQHGAVKAFDRFVEDLRREATVTIAAVSTSLQGRTGAAPTSARVYVASSFLALGCMAAAILVRGTAGRALNLASLVLLFVLVFGALRSKRRRKTSE